MSLSSKQNEARAMLEGCQAILAKAADQGRELTSSEQQTVRAGIARADNLKMLHEIDEFGRSMGSPTPAGSYNGPGDIFVRSDGYKAVQHADSRPQSWSTGPVDVGGAMFKGTLLGSNSDGPGGGPVPAYYVPGIAPKLLEYSGVADFFGSSETPGSQVRYVVEGTATSGVTGVAEAGVKPESTIDLGEVVEPVKKLATVLPVSDEMLEDAPAIQAYLNGRLTFFVKIEEERQLLRGAGGNDLIGLMARTGGQAINQYTKLAADDNSTALLKVISNTAGSANLRPDLVVLHPSNYLSTRLLRDGTGGTVGAYLGGGPFSNQPQAGAIVDNLWGVPVVLSSVVGVGTALVGNFGQGAHLWRRGGLSVEATNSHDTYFVRNLNMIRAEQREALGLYRPAAFTEVRGLA
jgi:HK97 family phage major capsid protein